MMMHKVLHPGDGIDNALCDMKRNKKTLPNIGECGDVLIRRNTHKRKNTAMTKKIRTNGKNKNLKKDIGRKSI